MGLNRNRIAFLKIYHAELCGLFFPFLRIRRIWRWPASFKPSFSTAKDAEYAKKRFRLSAIRLMPFLRNSADFFEDRVCYKYFDPTDLKIFRANEFELE